MESQSDEDLEWRANREWREFYARLESRVKRFPPQHFGPEIVRIMQRHLNRGEFQFAPPHQISLAIEANCAHARGHARDILTQKEYAALHRVFVEFSDLYALQLLDNDFGTWVLQLRREQIEIQRGFSKLDFSRYYRIFIRDNPIPRMEREFTVQRGISVREWIRASMVIFAKSLQHEFTLPRPIRVEGMNIDPHTIETYLKDATISPREIGARFLELRRETRPKFHRLIKSVFFERPIIEYPGDRFLAPFHSLVFHHVQNGLYPLLVKLPSFSREFGPSVQRYVGYLLELLTKRRRLLTDRELEENASDQSCDFLLEFDEYIILLEVKATSFTRRWITPATIPQDNSTQKLIDAAAQIYKSARDVRGGKYEGLDVDAHKPIYGIIVTFGEIPFANAPWYFSEYVQPHVVETLGSNLAGLQLLEQSPIVLSISDVEFLVAVINRTGTGLPELARRKESRGLAATGDWDTFLAQLAQEHLKGERPFEHIDVDGNDFFESLGIPRRFGQE